ncbi:PDR/VanB family oxidoreductase [Antrihabitans cavernicola]|uniref:Oxidoreductase n=1 Tax=Antrihabitans cavernicola TaxID=2495913 RepID=A0A5A7S0Q9_9NOCA|nr:PDR/VanB family oxidoreductase [Spelaeibacter cavernicola]KAA0016301.1 oxidoreductase [Spelaeibacter cavernicola]
MIEQNPSPLLRTLDFASRVYSKVFAESPIASVLSRPRQIKRTGFDMDLIVERVVVEADDVVSLTLVRPDGKLLPRWIPGAHVDIFLPSGKQRQYSLNGSPADLTKYRIAVRRIADGGGGSLEVHSDIAAGDVLRVRGPRNAFTFIPAKQHLFIAGGIGITPILPMVRMTATGGGMFKVIYLGRSRDSMPFVDELRAVAGDRLDVRPDDEVGFPDVAELLKQADPGAAVYLCGPPPLLDAARALMPQINPTGSLHTERFSAPPVVGGEPFEVVLSRSGKTVQVAADESALSAIRRAVPSVSYSCQQGFCRSCKVDVLGGTVEHRDSTLLPDERETSMLICVSRAAGARVAVDL